MGKYEDHPFIKTMRNALDIPAEADFVEAVVPKFACADPNGRKADLYRMETALNETRADLRAQTQLGKVTRQLRTVDEKLRRTGR